MKPTIDFHIASDAYNLIISDFSDWNIIESKPSIIEITLPGDSTPVKKYFDKNKVVTFTSITLDINCGPDPTVYEKLTLPDGIYTIKITGSPDKFNKERKYLKTDNVQLEIDKLVIDAFEKNCVDKIEKKLTEINMLLVAAKAYLRYDNIKTSELIFDQVSDMVDDLKDCNTCGCD